MNGARTNLATIMALFCVSSCTSAQAPALLQQSEALSRQALTQICLPALIEDRAIDAEPSPLFSMEGRPPNKAANDVRGAYRAGTQTFIFENDQPGANCNINVYAGDFEQIRSDWITAFADSGLEFDRLYCGPTVPRSAHRDLYEAQLDDGRFVGAVITTSKRAAFLSLSTNLEPTELDALSVAVPEDWRTARHEDTGFSCAVGSI